MTRKLANAPEMKQNYTLVQKGGSIKEKYTKKQNLLVTKKRNVWNRPIT